MSLLELFSLQLTKVYIQHQCICTLHYNVCRLILECFVHVAYCVANHWTNLLSIVLQINNKILDLNKAMMWMSGRKEPSEPEPMLEENLSELNYPEQLILKQCTLYFITSSSMFVLRPGYLHKLKIYNIIPHVLH